jgi:flagellar hook assembly protein FlgD
LLYFGGIGEETPEEGAINVTWNGNVGIGTSEIPSNYKLTDAGNIKAQEIKIQHPNQWYDYDFEENYKLSQLS